MDNVESQGEVLHPQWIYQFIDNATIPAGSFITPIELDSEEAKEFSDLHLIRSDLEFAFYCFTEAAKIGIPSDTRVCT